MAEHTVRVLGRSGIQVSALGMGCWAIGGPFWAGEDALGWGEVEDAQSVRAIHCALDLGATFFDTADVYGAGRSERVLGSALAGRRDRVVVATKFGNLFDEASLQVTGAEASPDYIRHACEASLRRLATDYIDLYQLHINDHDPALAGPIVATLEELVAEGKIRTYGWSTDFRDRARAFAEGPHCTAIQFQQNVLEDNAGMIELCEQLNLAGINRGPLAMGLLTGKYHAGSRLADDDVRGDNSPAWLQYFTDGTPNPVWLTKVAAIREVLQSEGRTLAQGAIAWLWARSPMTLPIPGFRLASQVEENCTAMEHGLLSAEQMGEIEEILRL